MRVGQVIEELKAFNPDAEFRVGMWYGGGSPMVQTYELHGHFIDEFNPAKSEGRYKGPHIVYIAASDMKRTAGVHGKSETHEQTIRDLRHLRERMRDSFNEAIEKLQELV